MASFFLASALRLGGSFATASLGWACPGLALLGFQSCFENSFAKHLFLSTLHRCFKTKIHEQVQGNASLVCRGGHHAVQGIPLEALPLDTAHQAIKVYRNRSKGITADVAMYSFESMGILVGFLNLFLASPYKSQSGTLCVLESSFIMQRKCEEKHVFPLTCYVQHVLLHLLLVRLTERAFDDAWNAEVLAVASYL